MRLRNEILLTIFVSVVLTVLMGFGFSLLMYHFG